MSTIFDALPCRVLADLERLETSYTDKEHQAFRLEAEAQDLRIRYSNIIASWKIRAAQEGLDNLVAEAQRQDAIAWVCDPLPNKIPSEY
jgi:hypothetical protein